MCMYDRILKLISKEDLEKIRNTRVLLIGLGGVGGYAFECLIRSGFLKITVIDKDSFEESNLNRQILSTRNTLNLKKTEVAKERANDISLDIEVTTIFKNLQKEDITTEFIQDYDYIIDACDSVPVKVELIRVCSNAKTKLISSMGTANRIHPEMLQIRKLKDTQNDPLAKKLRTLLKKEEKALKTPVVCSMEIPKKQKELGTFVPVPMSAGAYLVSYVIRDILNQK